MSEISVEKIEAMIGSAPLLAIDYALQALSRSRRTETSDVMALLSEAILTHLGRPTTDNPIDDLFDKDLSHHDRRFVAVCLVRLLAVNGSYFNQHRDFRVNAFALFDDVLSKDVYAKIGIDSRQQTYEKSMKLRDVAPRSEEIMDDAIESLTNLDRLGEFQEQFMKALNSPLVKAVMVPFLPRKLILTSRLREVFHVVREYLRAAGPNVREAFEHAQEVVEQYREEAEVCKTYYCQHYLAVMSRELEHLLKEHFLNSDAGQPADLIVRPLDKKYPFHQVGQDLTLGFVIENRGPGYAFEVRVEASSLVDNIEIKRPHLHLGRLEPGSLFVDFPAQVEVPEKIAFIQIEVSWHNADGSPGYLSSELELEAQRTDIDWESLELEDPYSLEPVETHYQLVGRKEIINQLVRQSYAKSVGSSYILGQKRVGKTSIAKALRSRLEQHENFMVIYLEGGEYIDSDPRSTLSRLGTKLCEQVKKGDKRLSDIPIPNFGSALYPLGDFLDNVHDAVPELRVLFILDEFDEIPIELYRRGPLADAFFLTLRTISGKPPFGFVLVGGEKMDFIKSCQGDTFNKFRETQVDYFDREEHWSDFQTLVRRPTEKWLDITDDAIIALYEQTAGNPYFTMCICREMFSTAISKRDCSVTRREIEDSVPLAIKHIGTGFYHFWEDGIFEPTGDRVEEVSIRRRKVLLALANVLRHSEKAGKADIVAQDIVSTELDQTVIESELRRFVQRRVLVEDNGLYDCKVPFFKTWLMSVGVRDILTTFSDFDAVLERRRREEEAYVQDEEIVELTDGWGSYQGRKIGSGEVRAWLNQFGDYISQRLMFKILQGIRFYSDGLIRERLKEAHGIVRRGLVWEMKKGERKRRDILVSYLDFPGKSGGGKYAKLYADENGIYYRNVVERSRIAEVVSQRKDLQALVFIDDFIGTGESVRDYFKQLERDCGVALREANLKRIYFIAITGFQESQDDIERAIARYGLPIEVHILDPLDSSDRCFGENSRIFPERSERLQAERIAYEHGVRIVKRNPLGYGNCQSTVVFSDSCPNNDLPILWAESADPPWRPLFRRLTRRR